MDITEFLQRVNYYVFNPIIVLLFGVATLYFIYGIIRFLSTNAGDKSATRIEARNSMLWGIVGMFVMISVYALIRLVLVTFGITTGDIGTTAIEFIKFSP